MAGWSVAQLPHQLKTDKSAGGGPRAGSISTWAMLIKRVYEVDPLECPQCGGVMNIISFIERSQQDVIERILRHCGLWEGPLRTLASARAPPHGSQRDPNEPRNLELVPDPEFIEAEFREAQAEASRKLQLVLDPDFLRRRPRLPTWVLGMIQVDLTPRTRKVPSKDVHAAVSRPSRQEISLQVLDIDRHHCQNRASTGMKIPISSQMC